MKNIIMTLLFLCLLLFLASVFVVRYDHPRRGGVIRNTRQKQSELSTAIAKFKIDCGQYPTTEQGLRVLMTKPDGVMGWKGPYIKNIPVDSWNLPFRYNL